MSSSSTPSAAPVAPKRSWFLWVKLVGTALGVAYIARLINFAQLRAVIAGLSPWTVAAAIASIFGGLVVGALRWRILLHAYGADKPLPFATALRLTLIATFYNNYVPGGVTGDLLRGVATRECFVNTGTTSAIAVVLVERALGLFSVFALVGLGLLFARGTAVNTDGIVVWVAIGMVGATCCVAALPFARLIGPKLPAPLAKIAARLPAVSSLPGFAAAVGLSLMSQLAVAIAGWIILRDVAPIATFRGALLVVPLAAATAYLPITVGGTGAREAVFASMCTGLFAMSNDQSVGASLVLWISILTVGAIGGVLQLTGRKDDIA